MVKAYETDLEFSGMGGRAIVVEFGKPYRLVFWAGAQYVGCWDLGGGVWFTPEWLETNSPEDLHCYEPIMDKQLLYSRVKIMERGPARAKVHWHYACNDLRYRVFNGNTFADEYYTVYPDGIAIRKLVAWPGDENDHGGNPNFWQVLEYILINEAGVSPFDTVNKSKAFSFRNEKGNEISYGFPLPTPRKPLCQRNPEVASWKTFIGQLHLVNRPSPFVIFPNDQRLFPHKPCTECGKDHPWFGLFAGASVFKHWPAYPREDFVLAVAADKDEMGKVATHTSFLDCNYTSIPADRPPRPTSWLFLTGAQVDDSIDLLELANAWLNPARVTTGFEKEGETDIEGCAQGRVLYEGYAYSQRAYTFRKLGEDEISFRLEPEVDVINPVFVIDGWLGQEAIVEINGGRVPLNRYQVQREGSEIIVWLEQRIREKVNVRVVGGKK